MKKIISRVTYNTETALEIGRIACGTFGDPAGYEEILYQTKKGAFFIYGNGGAESKYTEETIVPLTKTEAKDWKNANL